MTPVYITARPGLGELHNNYAHPWLLECIGEMDGKENMEPKTWSCDWWDPHGVVFYFNDKFKNRALEFKLRFG